MVGRGLQRQGCMYVQQTDRTAVAVFNRVGRRVDASRGRAGEKDPAAESQSQPGQSEPLEPESQSGQPESGARAAQPAQSRQSDRAESDPQKETGFESGA